jgi:hypothetical protein
MVSKGVKKFIDNIMVELTPTKKGVIFFSEKGKNNLLII